MPARSCTHPDTETVSGHIQEGRVETMCVQRPFTSCSSHTGLATCDGYYGTGLSEGGVCRTQRKTGKFRTGMHRDGMGRWDSNGRDCVQVEFTSATVTPVASSPRQPYSLLYVLVLLNTAQHNPFTASKAVYAACATRCTMSSPSLCLLDLVLTSSMCCRGPAQFLRFAGGLYRIPDGKQGCRFRCAPSR